MYVLFFFFFLLTSENSICNSSSVLFKVREFGMDMCTLLYLKWITSENRLCSTENSARCYVPAWMGGEFGGEWIHVSV